MLNHNAAFLGGGNRSIPRVVVLCWLGSLSLCRSVAPDSYLWGIVLLAGVAIFGLVDRTPKARAWMGLALGVALALIVDEAALLITLEDVYWQSEGWPSVALAISVIGIVGTGLVLTRSRSGNNGGSGNSDG